MTKERISNMFKNLWNTLQLIRSTIPLQAAISSLLMMQQQPIKTIEDKRCWSTYTHLWCRNCLCIKDSPLALISPLSSGCYRVILYSPPGVLGLYSPPGGLGLWVHWYFFCSSRVREPPLTCHLHSAEPMFSVQTWMFETEKKGLISTDVQIGMSANVYKNALISNLNRLNLYPFSIRSSVP